jgi:hypothetical protein
MVGTAAGRMARVTLIVSSVLLAATAYAANTINGGVLVAGAPVAKSEVTVTIVSQFRDQARLAIQWCRFRGQKRNSGSGVCAGTFARILSCKLFRYGGCYKLGHYVLCEESVSGIDEFSSRADDDSR